MESTEAAQRGLHILTVTLTAVERRHVVVRVRWDAPTEDAGRDAIRDLLGCDEIGARVVMDFQ